MRRVSYQLSSCPTSSNLNLFYIVEIFDWLNTNGYVPTINLLQSPSTLAIYNLPPHVKDKCREKILQSPYADSFKFLINLCDRHEFDEELWQKFVIKNHQQDVFRGSYLKEAMPEFWKLIEADYQRVLAAQNL